MEDVLATRTLAMASNCCSAPTLFVQSAMAHGHFRDIGKQIEILPTSVTSNQSHGEVLKTKACICFFLVQFLSLEKVATIHRFAAPVRSGKAVEVLGNRQTIVVLLWARRFPSVPIELEFVVLAMKGVQRTNFMLFSYVIGRKKRKNGEV